MTLAKLKEKIYRIGVCCHGQFEVVIEYRNKFYRCQSNNTLAYDTLHSVDEVDCYYTTKQALMALYIECKDKNKLR